MLMSVTMIVITVLDAGGAGVVLSVDGTSPANTVPESAHASAMANTKRFIVVSPFGFTMQERLQ